MNAYIHVLYCRYFNMHSTCTCMYHVFIIIIINFVSVSVGVNQLLMTGASLAESRPVILSSDPKKGMHVHVHLHVHVHVRYGFTCTH